MKKIKCSSKLTSEELAKTIKYGNYPFSSDNIAFVWFLIIAIIGVISTPEFELILIIIAIINFILLIFKFYSTDLLIKKQIKILSFPFVVDIEFKENSFIYTRKVLTKNEPIEIPYNYVSYIMKIEDFIILNIETLKNDANIIVIKKEGLNTDTDYFKEFIFNKCRKLNKFKITNPIFMYVLLKICSIVYLLFISLYFIFSNV